MNLKFNYKNKINFDDFYESIFEKTYNKTNEKNSIDLIISNSVLEHLPKNKIKQILTNLFEIHKKDGYFFICSLLWRAWVWREWFRFNL